MFKQLPGLALLAMLILASCEKNDDNVLSLKEEMIDAGGYQLYTRTVGDKKPTLVLITGIAGTTDDWKTMENDLAEIATVINYDREGLGKSPWQQRPKDSKTIAEELHTLLAAKGLEPPYIIAAHSIGGLHARVFTHFYKNEVAGLLLVDPTPEDLIDSLLAGMSPEDRAFYLEQIRQQEDAINQMPDGAIKSEIQAINTCYEQARTLSFDTKSPVAIISSMKLENGDSYVSKNMAKQLRDQLLENISLGPNKHYLTDQSGHFVQKDQPELVMEALHWILENRE